METYMKRWRDGLISDSEILVCLVTALAEVALAMRLKEDKEANERGVTKKP